VTLSSEPPEYWQALFGGNVEIDTGVGTSFPGDPAKVLNLYQTLVSPQVQLHDLIDPVTGQYNVYNKWNTTHGIAHLNSPPNTIGAEIKLGADATVLYGNKQGPPVVEPSALICCAGYGGPDRNSDPTIGATVNALARLGAMITLANPVGLYMDHIDLSGWKAPKGVEIEECVRVVRGRPKMIERLVVEVPANSGFTVGDLKIAGVPIDHGGQIAECITVKLVGAAAQIGQVANAPTDCVSRCCVDPANATALGRPIEKSEPTPVGRVEVFQG